MVGGSNPNTHRVIRWVDSRDTRSRVVQIHVPSFSFVLLNTDWTWVSILGKSTEWWNESDRTSSSFIYFHNSHRESESDATSRWRQSGPTPTAAFTTTQHSLLAFPFLPIPPPTSHLCLLFASHVLSDMESNKEMSREGAVECDSIYIWFKSIFSLITYNGNMCL